MALRRSCNHSSVWDATSFTHQARASDRLRATPLSTRVSSTRRSGWRSRVMTGTARWVKSCEVDPTSTPQATLRPNRCSASRAMAMRSSRVSSRNRLARPASAAAWAAGSLSAGTSGAATRPTMTISSRSTVTVGASSNHWSGSRPVNQPARPSVVGASSTGPLPGRPPPAPAPPPAARLVLSVPGSRS